MPDTFHIAFCVGENYFQYVAVSMRSILDNNEGRNIVFHILTDSISNKAEQRIRTEFVRYKNVSLSIHLINKNALTDLICGYWTKYTWYRILLPDVLPSSVSRVLYLDADTLVVGNISPLFALNMEGMAVAGCLGAENFLPETFDRCGYPSYLKYLCAGVLLINLEYWRSHDLSEKAILWEKQNRQRIKYPDQDTINFVCRDNKIVLPMKYGVIGQYFMSGVLPFSSFKDELIECLLHPVIIHYPNQSPWKKEISHHPFQNEWVSYNRKLRHPARRYYITKGWPLIKMIVWRTIHPFSLKRFPTRQEILLKWFASDSF